METMTKRERVQAALRREEVDHVPVSIWHHLPDVDQDPINLAERTLELSDRFNYDFIKMMPFGNYPAQDYGLSVKFYCTETQTAKEREFGIGDVSDWRRLEPLPAYYGTYGKQVQFAQNLARLLQGRDTPYIQTIFSPLTVAKKLAGPRVFEDIKADPAAVHQALAAITQTTINFCKANVEAGVAGFFMASQCSSYDLCTEETYAEFGTRYDLQVLEAIQKDTWFNVIHIHGDHTMFERMAAYPVQCVNWHDRWVSPSLAEARKLTDKCLLGGLHEKWLVEARPEEIEEHIRQAVESAGRCGLMIGPGCVAKLNTPAINFYAARLAAGKF